MEGAVPGSRSPALTKSWACTLVALLALPAGGCFRSPVQPIEAAETAVLKHVGHSNAVAFAHERVIYSEQTIVCGLLNIREPSGRSTGWRRFYVLGEPRHAWIDLERQTPHHASRRRHRARRSVGRALTPVTYEYLWNSVGCRTPDDNGGITVATRRLLSYFDS
jgi:hypothetical protein